MLWPNPLKKGKRFVRENEKKKKCFLLFRSLFFPDRNQQWIRNQIYFYLLFRWWFFFYIQCERTLAFFPESREWGTKEWESEKTCCLLLLRKILFVSWCQTFFIYSQHTLYYSAKIVQTLNLLPFQIGIQDNREKWRGA